MRRWRAPGPSARNVLEQPEGLFEEVPASYHESLGGALSAPARVLLGPGTCTVTVRSGTVASFARVVDGRDVPFFVKWGICRGPARARRHRRRAAPLTACVWRGMTRLSRRRVPREIPPVRRREGCCLDGKVTEGRSGRGRGLPRQEVA